MSFPAFCLVLTLALHIFSPLITHTGTDCQDCGPLGADNFTRADDDGWWDDDDDYWNLNDGEFIGTLCFYFILFFVLRGDVRLSLLPHISYAYFLCQR